MSEQVQHPLITLGIENLKSLLFNNEKHVEILNQQHKLYIAVNEKAQTVAYEHKAYAVVTFDIHGVRSWFFNFSGKKISGKKIKQTIIGTDIYNLTDKARKELQVHYSAIVSEEWERKYSILEPILGNRAKNLQRPDCFIQNTFGDPHKTVALTTLEERAALEKLGIKIFSWKVS